MVLEISGILLNSDNLCWNKLLMRKNHKQFVQITVLGKPIIHLQTIRFAILHAPKTIAMLRRASNYK